MLHVKANPLPFIMHTSSPYDTRQSTPSFAFLLTCRTVNFITTTHPNRIPTLQDLISLLTPIMPASPQTSKSTVMSFIAHLNDRTFSSLPALFHPTATWTVQANSTKASWGGVFAAFDMCTRAAAVTTPFEMWSYTARDIVVDVSGLRVVVDGVCHGRGPGPLRHDNNYMMKFCFDESGDRRIVELKETLDCYEVEIMFESMEEYKEGEWLGWARWCGYKGSRACVNIREWQILQL